MTDTRDQFHERESQVAPPVRSGEIAHTPGPWTLKFDPEQDRRHEGVAFEIERDGFLIQGVAAARDECGSGFFSNDVARANARLIAAAPDMLAALNAIKTFGELANVSTQGLWPSGGKKPSSKDVWQFPRHMLTELDAAIAKATMTAPQSEQAPLSRETGAAS